MTATELTSLISRSSLTSCSRARPWGDATHCGPRVLMSSPAPSTSRMSDCFGSMVKQWSSEQDSRGRRLAHRRGVFTGKVSGCAPFDEGAG